MAPRRPTLTCDRVPPRLPNEITLLLWPSVEKRKPPGKHDTTTLGRRARRTRSFYGRQRTRKAQANNSDNQYTTVQMNLIRESVQGIS
ncbi:hypothetical protein OSTOST_18478 [Ostertagia ostertagi]